MLYALLCYNSEEIVGSWSKKEDDEILARLAVVHERLQAQGKLGPTARLMPTTAATTVRKVSKGRRLEAGTEPPTVIDGPYAETKEQLLGFFIVDCTDLEEALSITRELSVANPGGAYEIRPVSLFLPGSGVG